MKVTRGAIEIPRSDLNLGLTLTPGQSFRWKKDFQGRWVGVVSDHVVKLWRDGGALRYEIYGSRPDDRIISRYFRLEIDISNIYDDLVARDPGLARVITRLKGLRVLRQDPEETLLAYVCTTANSLGRIIAGVEELSTRYGKRIGEIDERQYFSFPTAEVLAHTAPDELCSIRNICFRGKSLRNVAQQLVERPPGWLESLRHTAYHEARSELLAIRGIGPKIADCVLLFSLAKDEAFPIDTHILKVATENYLPDLKNKALTPSVYERIADYFRHRFGPFAGWAQEYLFYDHLYAGRLGRSSEISADEYAKGAE